MKTKKNLFLWWDKNDFYPLYIEKKGLIEIDQGYKKLSFLLKIIRKILIRFNIPLSKFWFGKWKENLDNYNTIIVHASILTPPLVKFIKKIRKDIRVIVWYWNPVSKCLKVEKIKNYNCEIWSFDEDDCKKYNLNYNVQYYFDDIRLSEYSNKYDIFFVGADKGRINKLLELQEQFEFLNLSTYFHITPTKESQKKYKKIYKKRLSYEKILELISKSRVILDYVSDNQRGLTIRPLEALFLKKKLITNDISIMKRDFYNKNNIFIIGKDNLKNLKNFIVKPYENIDEKIIKKYTFSSWIKNIID